MKNVFLMTGVGWGEQRELRKSIEQDLGWQLAVRSIGGDSELEGLGDSFGSADLIILRAAWTPTFEEALYSEFLATKLRLFFENLKVRLARNDDFKFLAIGRGAHCLLRAEWPELEQLRVAPWESYTEDVGTWTPCRFLGMDGEFISQIHARSFPRLELPSDSALQSWSSLPDGRSVGWHLKGRVFLSLIDPLSYQHPSQLLDYGYIDYSKLPTRQDFLKIFQSTNFRNLS